MQSIFGAIDIGASSGRVIAGSLNAGKISLEEVHRFPNRAVDSNGALVWDFNNIMAEVRTGLSKLVDHANEVDGKVVSLGVDTWAVDYGLVKNGELLAQPNCYRDPINQIGVEDVHGRVSFAELYSIAGLQFLPFNSVYQLARQSKFNPEQLAAATDIMLIPDLIGFFLTGNKATEKTNASSTGMLDARTNTWSEEIVAKAGVADVVLKFPKLGSAGDVLGQVLPEFGDGLRSTRVVLVGSHDTASAVVGVPATSDDFAYISSGTWSLLGTELPAPILTEASRSANFTNELGVQGRVRYLKNLSGLWLLTECLRDWKVDANAGAFEALLSEASSIRPEALLDLSDETLIAPGNMPEKINRQLERSNQRQLQQKQEYVAVILHSLAKSYAENLCLLEQLTAKKFDALHVVGGGSQNALLSQLTANYCRRAVLAGPVEATAIGNIVVQMQTAGLMPEKLNKARAAIANSNFHLTTYQPEGKNHG
jgi:rhamnulokinase